MRISPTILDIITALRTAIEMDDSSHTTSLTRELSRLPEFEGSTATAGYRVSPEGDIKDDHWWLIMDDGSVFDADEEEPMRCSKKDSRHGRYFPYTGETGIPAAVLQAADHIRAKSRTANNKSFSDMVGEAAENHDTQIQNAGISGFGGQCFSAAIKINHQFFNGEGEYVIAFNKAFMQHGVFYGHAAVLHNGTYWDADGKPKEVYDIESWGMLAEDDPDYQEQAAELGFEFDENNAYDVGMKIVDEKTLQQYCSMNEASGASAPSGVARQAPEALPDAMNVDGKEGIVVDEFDDETKPEDLQMGWEDLVGEDEGDDSPANALITALRRKDFGNVGLSLNKVSNDVVEIGDISNNASDADQHNRGVASDALRTVTNMADRLGVTLQLIAHHLRYDFDNSLDYWTSTMGSEWVQKMDAIQNSMPTIDKLKAWYSRNGFTDKTGTDPSDGHMVREPKIVREVDHPGYMPDGEGGGTDNYDPTYDERSVHTNAGWPRP